MSMKWFKFYTTWRPWICLVGIIIILLNIISVSEYRDIWFSNIENVLNLLLMVIDGGLSIIVYYKTKNISNDTVSFINIVLWVNIVNIAFAGTNSIGKYKIDSAEFILIFLINLILGYFIWLKTNKKYFENREWYFEEETSNISNTKKTEDNDKSNNIESSNENSSTDTIKYCTNCGKKVETDWTFCNYCGKKI